MSFRLATKRNVQLDWLVGAMTKVISNKTMKDMAKTSQGTQYKGPSNYISRLRQSQLACGANGTFESNVFCHYCKDMGQTKDNCFCLNYKITRHPAAGTGDGSQAG